MYNKSEQATIQTMFDNIANSYDKTNSVLSFFMHHLWNASLVKNVVVPCLPQTLVDLCAGTGEIAFRSLKAVPQIEHACLIDFSQEMLECAKNKAKKLKFGSTHIDYLQADVQQIPIEDASIDCVTMAYGIRNVCDVEKCMREVFRILKPGGSFGILELTRPTNFLLRAGHTSYLQIVLPLLGKLMTTDEKAYRYLCNSIHTFVEPEALKNALHSTGFYHLRISSLSKGIATLFIAQKPHDSN